MKNKSLSLNSALLPWAIRCGDAILVFTAGLFAFYIRPHWMFIHDFPSDLSAYYNLIALGALLFAFLQNGAYQSWRGSALPSILAKVCAKWLGVIGILLVWLFIFKLTHDFSRSWFMIWIALSLIFLCAERVFIYLLLRQLRRRGFNIKSVAVLGSGEAVELIHRRLDDAGWTGYKIARSVRNLSEESLALLGQESFDEVWLALSMSQNDDLKRILHELRHSTAAIRFVPDMFTFRLVNHGADEVMGIAMYNISASPMTGINLLLKWLEDKVISALILILISPIFLLLSIGVKLSSSGPVFYRQERIGLNNQPFLMFKFRSMPVDVEKEEVKWGGGSSKATTWFGQFIRRTSLDELPQFINVLKGDMSIVGPRPERPMFVEKFKDEIPGYMKKHLVKAGITGWAQVHGWRGDTDLKMRIEYDLYYIENWSLLLDLRIILMTFSRGFVNKNAY